MKSPVLELRDVTKCYGSRRQPIWALSGINLKLQPGETLGIVGESGSGKSTLARIAVGLEMPTSGAVTVNGQPCHGGRGGGGDGSAPVQMVFQDPASSLDPLFRIAASVGEPMQADRAVPAAERSARVLRSLEEVGLGRDIALRYPDELSGGQKQRASIARALVGLPQVIICDEAVTALDVSIRAQVLNLLRSVQDQHGTGFIFISHDLCTVAYMSDRIMVMYLGAVMEVATRERLFATPAHPYTYSLLSAVPALQQGSLTRARLRLKGDPPSAMHQPSGCRFHTRCPLADDRCRREQPALRDIAPGHAVACHYAPVSEAALGVAQDAHAPEAAA